MAIKQLSVFVENKPGKVLEYVNILAEAKINMRAMSIADTKEFGVLRLIVSDTHKAKEALGDSAIAIVTDVVAVEMKDEAGALNSVLEILSSAEVNIEYMYAFTAPVDGVAYVVLRVNDNAAAEEILKANGIGVLNQLNA